MGQVTGIAFKTAPSTLTLRKKPDGDAKACQLVLRFTPDGQTVRVKETSCGDWHGAECAFDGRLTEVLPAR